MIRIKGKRVGGDGVQREQGLQQLRTQVSSIALAGAGKILGREIDAKAHSDLLDKLVAEI